MLPFGVVETDIDDVLFFRRRIDKQQLIQILGDYERGVSFHSLSKQYGVNRWTIADIFQLLHVPIRTNLSIQLKPKLLTKAQRKEAAQRVHNGERLSEVVRSFGIAKNNLYRISGQIIDTLVEELDLPIPKRYRVNPNSNEKLSRIYKAWKSGKSTHQIAKMFGSDSEKITYMLHKCGAKLNSKPWRQLTDNDRKKVVDEFKRGATVRDLAEMFGCSPYYIIKWLRLDVGTATHYDREMVMRNVDKAGFRPGTKFPDVVKTKAGTLRRQCQELTPETLPRLVDIINKGQDRDALKAIEMLWDRGWGKPKETYDDDDVSLPVHARLASMVSSKLQNSLKIVDAVPVETPQLEDQTTDVVRKDGFEPPAS